jgi:sugar phosphate isomerase/epimerase
MRLGGPVFVTGRNPEEYALAHVKKGYKAGLCPDYLTLDKPEEVKAFKESFERHDIIFAEVGAWCNPLSQDSEEAHKNIEYIINKLRIADALEARTCVNIIGTKYKDNWFGPSKECYEPQFFKQAVETVRYIVDTVKPKHTKYSLEMMPYCFLDSPEEYLRFLEAVDRKEVGIHLDICNCINNPRLLYDNTNFIRHTFELLGKEILSIHLKDIRLNPNLTTASFDEVVIGTGELDYKTLMQEIVKLPEDVPAILEHLSTDEEYTRAADSVRMYAKNSGMNI